MYTITIKQAGITIVDQIFMGYTGLLLIKYHQVLCQVQYGGVLKRSIFSTTHKKHP